MIVGLLLGLAAAAELIAASHSGELSAFFLEGGTPWVAVALFAITLVMLAKAAPATTRPLATCVALAFLWTCGDPSAPRQSVQAMFFPLLALAVTAFVAAMMARKIPARLTSRSQIRSSSRHVRVALRTYSATRA